MKPCNGFPLHQ